jgi:RimJ/RimL family protein N-acetyltransferase
MIAIITGRDAALTELVESKFAIDLGGRRPAIGFADGPELLGAVVYHNYQWPNIEATIWTGHPRWCNRRTLFACFWYPFLSLNCRRFGATTAATNQPSKAFLCRLGFRREGIARQAMHDATAPGDGVCDAIIYGMLASECRWLGRLAVVRPAAPATDQRRPV